MPTITISQSTMDLIEEAKLPGVDFRPTGTRRRYDFEAAGYDPNKSKLL